LHDDWGAIGVGLTIHVWSDDEYFAPAGAGGVLQGGKFDAAVFSHGPGPPYANLAQDYGCADFPPNGFNVDRYCNRAVDAANDRYQQSFDAAERARLGAASQRTIDADAPAIILYLRIALSAFDDRLRGYHPSAYTSWGDPLQLDI
jgi:ABC-type transport system substrate-binding protein